VALFPVIFLPMMGVSGHHYRLEDQYFNKASLAVVAGLSS
jgi:hypothetical protein